MGEVEPPRAIGLGLLAPQILCRFAPFGWSLSPKSDVSPFRSGIGLEFDVRFEVGCLSRPISEKVKKLGENSVHA